MLARLFLPGRPPTTKHLTHSEPQTAHHNLSYSHLSPIIPVSDSQSAIRLSIIELHTARRGTEVGRLDTSN
jgi:hypothetical protein